MVTEKLRRLLHRPRKPSLKERLSTAIHLLNSTSNKLKYLSERVKIRDNKFFQKCVEAEMTNNHMRAIIYANECAQIRKLARLILSSELALEQATLRLQTLHKLGDVIVAINPILEIVQETKDKLVGIVPSIANNLNDVNDVLMRSFSDMGTFNSLGTSNNTFESMKILEAANLSAEEKIRDRFPKLPENFTTPGKLNTLKIPVALTVTGASFETEVKESLEKLVLEHFKARNGNVSIEQCASLLGVSTQDVEKALIKLKEKNQLVTKERVALS